MSDAMRNTQEARRIALLMPRADAHTRGIFRGITRYARPFRAWNFHLGLPHADVLGNLRRWKPAGIIATITDARLERRIAAMNLPIVNCSSNLSDHSVDRVITDMPLVGKLAAEYFLERGLPHLAYCGEAQSHASRLCHDSFRRRAASAGVTVQEYARRDSTLMIGEIGWRVSSSDAALQRWITSLPKPVGLLACHDPMAMLLSEVCREIGVNVPGQVSILGIDNDVMLCEMAYPTLSSVQIQQEKIGFEAARRLDQLFHRRRNRPSIRCIAPLGIITRQSTDVLAADDRLVAEALRYIQEHADRPIRVSDVVTRVGLSRRALEGRFKAAVGHSILLHIQREHIALANRLLASTSLNLDDVAHASGFNSRERFSHVYRQVTGLTPRAAFPAGAALPQLRAGQGHLVPHTGHP
ncbi:MAG: DNA-binding transcriptional regulator [Phycisphaeraceae bacterium]|nr:DNA-binding transcriptional regulator [Phycisphaeraceae bacterium]